MPKNTIACKGEGIELLMITPVYKSKIKEVNVDGVKTAVEQQVLAKELRTKKWIRKDAITSVENYLTSRSTVSKTRSVIFDKYSGKYFATAHSTDNIIEVLTHVDSYSPKIGFKNYDNGIKISGEKSSIHLNRDRE